MNTDLLDNMRATSAFAFIFFAWDENDNCTLVSYSTQSFHLPAFKLKNN